MGVARYVPREANNEAEAIALVTAAGIGAPIVAVTAISVVALLTAVRVAVATGAPGANDQVAIVALPAVTAIPEGVNIVNEVFGAAVPARAAAAPVLITNADVVARLDNAIVGVGIALPAGGVSNEEKAIEAIRAVGFAGLAAVVNEASVEALLTSVRNHLNAGGLPADDQATIGNPANAAERAVFDSLFVAGGAGGVAATTREEAVNRINNAIRVVRAALPAGATDQDAAIVAIEGVNIDDGGIAGGNQYVYGKQKAYSNSYPKNVTFSKKTTHKQTHNKTVRRLQNIINNAL